MSNYKTHAFGGVVACCMVLYVLVFFKIISFPSPIQVVLWLVCCVSGSLFPDVDIKSRGQRYFYRALALLLLVCISRGNFIAVSACSVIAVLPLLVKHRGLFHELWFLVAAPCSAGWFLCSMFPQYRATILLSVLFFVMGCMSHLWLDFKPHRRIRLKLR